MYEVFRHWDTATVGLVNCLLEDAGIKTILRNWEGSNIVEIPIPVIYPNVCVLNKEDFERAKELISAFRKSPKINREDWRCEKCGESVDHELNECWNCGEVKIVNCVSPSKKASNGRGEKSVGP